MTFKLAIGSDHAGFEMKEEIIKLLQKEEIELTDFGTNSSTSCDYPDYAHKVAEAVQKNNETYGILVCGSANGVAMTANKHEGIRAAICWNEEIAQLARKHNNANVLCLPSRFIDVNVAIDIMFEFLKTEFDGGRHQNRIDKINL